MVLGEDDDHLVGQVRDAHPHYHQIALAAALQFEFLVDDLARGADLLDDLSHLIVDEVLPAHHSQRVRRGRSPQDDVARAQDNHR